MNSAFLNIDRDKVQLMGLQLNQVFSTLGYYMGQAYVNDFVEFGRIYQVKLEAGEQAQKVIDDVLKLLSLIHISEPTRP